MAKHPKCKWCADDGHDHPAFVKVVDTWLCWYHKQNSKVHLCAGGHFVARLDPTDKEYRHYPVGRFA